MLRWIRELITGTGDVPREIIIGGFDLVNAATFTQHVFFMVSMTTFLLFNFFLETGSHNQGWFQTYYIAKDDLFFPASQVL